MWTPELPSAHTNREPVVGSTWETAAQKARPLEGNPREKRWRAALGASARRVPGNHGGLPGAVTAELCPVGWEAWVQGPSLSRLAHQIAQCLFCDFSSAPALPTMFVSTRFHPSSSGLSSPWGAAWAQHALPHSHFLHSIFKEHWGWEPQRCLQKELPWHPALVVPEDHTLLR